jgi:hypothetical protein
MPKTKTMNLPFRELLAADFAELNKQGIFAVQNWMCCATCARHALRTEVGLADDASYVYWHDQREWDLRDQEEERRRNPGKKLKERVRTAPPIGCQRV